MNTSPTISIAIIEHESSARTALHHLLTDIGFQDILISEDLAHPSLSHSAMHYPLVFVGWKIWDQMKWSMLPTLQKFHTQQDQKVLLFVSIHHPINLLEAIRFGIDGYITSPFSLHNIHQKLHMLLPHVPIELHEKSLRGQRTDQAQKSPQSANTD